MGNYIPEEASWDKKYMEWKKSKSEKKLESFKLTNIEHSIKRTINAKKEPINAINQDREEIKKIKYSDKNNKIKTLLIVLAYLVPFLLLASILTYIFQPFGFEGKKYEIQIGKLDTNTNKPFYLDETTAKSSLSKPIQDGDSTYREIISTRPFNLIFKPDVVIPNSAQATLQLEFQGKNSDIYINNKLLFPGLANYSLLKSFDDQEVYIKNELLPYLKEIDENSNKATDFLIANFKGSTVYSTSSIILENPTLESISNYSKISSTINTTFRGPLNLALYGEDLKIKFIKQDLNWYEGEDNYNITVRDINKNIIFEQIYGDDGNSLNDSKLGEEQEFEINLEGQTPSGVYFLELQNDKNNRAVDETIKNIQTNTNKVIVLGNFLPWQPLTIYTENAFPKSLSFTYWWPSKNQNILIRSSDIFKIELNESYQSIKYPYFLDSGNYSLEFEKGYLWIYNNFAFSLSRENLFILPLIIQETKNNPDFIIIDKTLYKEESIILSQKIEISNEGNSTAVKLVNPETTKFFKAKLLIQ